MASGLLFLRQVAWLEDDHLGSRGAVRGVSIEVLLDLLEPGPQPIAFIALRRPGGDVAGTVHQVDGDVRMRLRKTPPT